MNNDFFISFPNEIIFTNQLDPKTTSKQQKYHVENDFYINIGKHGNPQKTYKRKDTTKDAEIQIYGLDTLLTEDNRQWDKFIEDIITPITNDWSISSKKINGKYCLIITCNADELNDDFSVLFNLRYKFEFLGTLKAHQKIYLNIKFINFKTNFFDYLKQDTIEFDYYISPNEKRFINNLYVSDNKKCDHEVKAIHKGEKAYIGWDLGQNPGIISSSLYDENGFEVANLPFCDCGPINNDRKFTLVVEKDGCTQSQSLPVYRTLWKKVADGNCPEGFKPDPKGNNKFFYRSSDRKYYTYIHPKLFRSANLVEWEEVAIQICDKPQDNFINYSCSYYYKNSITDDSLLICYTYNKIIILYEYNFNLNKLSKLKDLRNNDCKSCQAIKKDDIIEFFSVNENFVTNFDFQTKTGILYSGPKNSKIIAIDTLFFDNQTLLAILCNNNRVYVYDTDNKHISNIFEFENKQQKRIALVQTNSIYVILDNYTFELNDKEKFTDLHFTPNNLNETSMIIGARDKFVFSAIVQNKEERKKINIWNYSF